MSVFFRIMPQTLRNKLIFPALLLLGFLGIALPFVSHAAIYNATNLLGQVDVNSNPIWTKKTANNSPTAPNALGFNSPHNVAVDTTNSRLFVSDDGNNRILVFPLDANGNLVSSTPSYVLGQADFVSKALDATPSGLFSPESIAYDSANDRLFVVDRFHSRVMVFNVATSTITNGENALFELGQTNFTSSTGATAQNGLKNPVGVAYDSVNSRLFISDAGNNRVMAFSVPANATSGVNGENALFELGQTNFASSTATTTASGLNSPNGTAYDPTNNRLFVADKTNNRVMSFTVPANATSGINGENADFVLGQTNFTSSTGTSTQSGLHGPAGIFYDSANNRLFVPDSVTNARVVSFTVPANATSGINGENADFVLGQMNFTSSTASTTQNRLNGPSGTAYDSTNNRLFVADAGNNRVMAFAVPANATSGVNGENASFAIGHYDLSGALATASFVNGIVDDGFLVNAQGFDSLSNTVLDTINHRLFVSDSYLDNFRILVFPLDSANNITTTTAQYVLGACNFTTAGSGAVTSSTFQQSNLAYDSVNSRLFVSDGHDNRVLAFNVATSTIANCEGATFVLGQADFVSNGSAVAQNKFHGSDDVDYDSVNSRLFVADETNNRVMAFSIPANATSGINGENALFELGQTNFVTSTAATTQSGLHAPTGVAYDSVNARLFVDDSGNSRVMIFAVPSNATSGVNGENALFELGQTNFTSSTAATTQSGLNNTDDDTYDTTGNRLFVADHDNNRVTIFTVPANATSGFNGANAQNNIGQAAWTTNASGTSQNAFIAPESSHAYDPVNNRLYIYEASGYRVLQFNFIHITTASFPSSTVGFAYSQTIAVTSTQGTSQTYSIASGTLPAGLSLNSATGLISGIPTVATTTTVTIEADDNFDTGPFFDLATYTMGSVNGTSSAPQSLTASSSDTQVFLAWSIPATNGGSAITDYLLEYKETANPLWRSFVHAATTSLSIIVTGLTNNTPYDFRVSAVNSIGTSSPSSLVSATPVFPAPNATVGVGASYAAPPGGGGLPTLLATAPLATTTVSTSSLLAQLLSLYQTLRALQQQLGLPLTPIPAYLMNLSTSTTTAQAISSSTTPYLFSRNLSLWSRGSDVQALQEFLIQQNAGPAAAQLKTHGATTVFGPLTYNALREFQKHAGITPAAGYFGPKTRAYVKTRL